MIIKNKAKPKYVAVWESRFLMLYWYTYTFIWLWIFFSGIVSYTDNNVPFSQAFSMDPALYGLDRQHFKLDNSVLDFPNYGAIYSPLTWPYKRTSESLGRLQNTVWLARERSVQKEVFISQTFHISCSCRR